MIKKTRYVLAVADLGRSAQFYRDVLGFEIREIGHPGWRFFENDRCFIMAGERGKTLDHRSDIFSFGIVLYEMLTGRLPFQGPSGVETLNAILKEPTPPLDLDASAQDRDGLAELERVIRRCLAKDPEEHYQTTKDLLSELQRVRRDSDSSVTAAVIAGVLGLAVLGYFTLE